MCFSVLKKHFLGCEVFLLSWQYVIKLASFGAFQCFKSFSSVAFFVSEISLFKYQLNLIRSLLALAIRFTKEEFPSSSDATECSSSSSDQNE